MSDVLYSLTESGRLIRLASTTIEEFSNGRWGKLVRTLYGAEFMDGKALSEEEACLYMEKLKEDRKSVV